MSARPSTTWQTSYHALAVDSGESEEEEEEIVDTPPAVESTNTYAQHSATSRVNMLA
jgi:hypothetical protein